MTRICGILTLAAGLAIAGCQSGGDMWNSASTDQPNRAFDTNNNNPNNNPNWQSAQSDMKNQNEANMQSVANGTAGQPNRQADKMPAANLSVADRTFVSDAAAGGMYEVQSSQSAVMIKSTDDRVKMIAQHMVDDHTKANLQLKNLAQQKGFALDTVGLTTDQHNMIDQLGKLSGTDFDREYLRQQQAAHQDTITKFQTASSNANDKDLRDWAATTLPILRQHLSMINNDQPGNVGMER